jgi:hypothetical protein
VNVNVRPATETDPVLDDPVLADTENLIDPDPVPDVEPAGITKSAPTDADHAHPAPVETVTVNSPPAAPICAGPSPTVNEHVEDVEPGVTGVGEVGALLPQAAKMAHRTMATRRRLWTRRPIGRIFYDEEAGS